MKYFKYFPDRQIDLRMSGSSHIWFGKSIFTFKVFNSFLMVDIIITVFILLLPILITQFFSLLMSPPSQQTNNTVPGHGHSAHDGWQQEILYLT